MKKIQYTVGFYPSKEVMKWKSLTPNQRKKVMDKEWYIRWSYRNPATGKLERQRNIKGGINRIKTKSERLAEVKKLQKALIDVLNSGVTPYKGEFDFEKKYYTTFDALDYALSIKLKSVSHSTKRNYISRINQFKDFLKKHGYRHQSIDRVNRKMVIAFLNEVLEKSSERTRNNMRTDLSTMFTVLEQNDIIPYNFIKSIEKLKSTPKINKAFTKEQVKAMFNHMQKNDVWLYYYCAHVYYGLFRPIEVVRIRMEHIDTSKKIIISKTKTGNFRKQIPNILWDKFYETIDFSKYKNDHFLFTKNNTPGLWDVSEERRREYFGDKFSKKIKPVFNLEKEHTIYSFRHASIGVMFENKIKELQKNKTPNFEEKALDYIRSITLHKNRDIVRQYLRDIGYYKVSDWSDMLK